MPVDYPYRKNTEAIINERVAIMKQSATIEEAEKKDRFEIPIHRVTTFTFVLKRILYYVPESVFMTAS